MMSATAAANLLAASEQAAIVVALASVLVWMLRLDAPGVRYAVWRTIAAICLLLPWLQRYRPPQTRALVSVGLAASAAQSTGAASLATAHVDGPLLLLWLLAAGALLRVAWLVLGVIRLRHLRRDGGIESDWPLAEELQRTLGTRAELRYSSSVPQPVTFGLLRPVVLLPESLRSQPLDIQRAVVGHELIHVRRRDWIWLLVEELGLSLLWFHPAAWWVASRIQLAREEVVDELTVLLTGRRKPYVEALLAFSDPISVVPTAAFARRQHLLRRIALISREDLMSSRRIVASCAAMALVLPLGTWGAVSAFPLHSNGVQTNQLPTAPGPLERRAHRVTPENPVPRRIHYEPAAVPDIAKTTSAKVLLQLTLNDAGTVAEARPALIAVKGAGFNVEFTGEELAKKASGTATIWSPDPNLAQTIRDTVLALADSAVTSVKNWRYDPPAEAPLTFSVSIRYGDEPETMVFSAKQGDALRVGGEIRPPVKVRDVRPVYPADARAAGINGVVILEVRIAADGSVETARVLKSIPELDQAALDAVKQWQFTPTLMNGVPTPLMMTVTVNFSVQ